MSNGNIIVKVLAYGVPALLIVLGFLAFTGGKFAEAIFGSSGGMEAFGIILIIVGVVIYILELLFGS